MDKNEHRLFASVTLFTPIALLPPQSTTDSLVAVVGSKPDLPDNFAWPEDKERQPMRFVAQIDFGALFLSPGACANLPESGMLAIFCAEQISAMPPKDRRAFALVYWPTAHLDQSDRSRDRLTAIRAVNKADPTDATDAAVHNRPLACDNHLLGEDLLSGGDLTGLERQKEIAAFAASGISHSPARAADDHYSHLIAEVPNWILLAQFGKTRVLIRRQDLASKLFQRAWVMVS